MTRKINGVEFRNACARSAHWAWRHRVLVSFVFVVCWFGTEIALLKIPQANAAYTLDNSARFISGSSDYLTRTPSSNGNQKTWTYSAWIKRAQLPAATDFTLLGASNGGGSIATEIRLNGTGSFADKIDIYSQGIGSPTTIWEDRSDAVYRDPATWFHLVVAVDTTQSAATNRLKVYVNGIQQTGFSSSFNLNDNTTINSTTYPHTIGKIPYAAGYGDNYLSDVYLIDGQQFDPTSFGETDANGYWRPKSYAGTYGTNGFHLNFSNSAALGTDSSGNGNDWTVNGLTANDQVTDSPTNSFATGNPLQPSSGTITAGNLTSSGLQRSTYLMTSGKWYWEVKANAASVVAGVISETGTASTTSVTNGTTAGFLYDADDKILYYTTDGTSFTQFGSGYTGNQFAYATGASNTFNFGQGGQSGLTYYSDSGGYFKYQPSSIAGAPGSQNFTTGTTPWTVPDYDTLTIWLKAPGGGGGGGGHWAYGGTGATGGASSCVDLGLTANGGGGGSGGSWTLASEAINGANGSNGVASGGDTNTTGGGASGGAGGVNYSVPSTGHGGTGGNGGYVLKTFTYGAPDAPTPGSTISITISGPAAGGAGVGDLAGAGSSSTAGSGNATWTTTGAAISGYKALSTANLPEPTITVPKNYFDAKTYTGSASDVDVTMNFTPDFVWIKQRTSVIVGGAEVYHHLFDTLRGLGKVLYTNVTNAEFNSGSSWITAVTNGFRAEGSGQINAGATATYISWNWKESPTSGFAIVTYSGNSATRAVAHNLGVAPSMIIVKNRTNSAISGDGQQWAVYHRSVGPGHWLLFLANAAVSNTSIWQNTNPTASEFYLGNGAVGSSSWVNASGNDYVAYLFAEKEGYSKFGSYTGNGSTDGPFVYTGFKPRYILVKRTDSTGGWYSYDTARDTYNPMTLQLRSESSTAEVSATTLADALANGFKLRSTAADFNASGGTYIYAAFAEQPFKYSAMPAAASGASAGTVLLMGMTF